MVSRYRVFACAGLVVLMAILGMARTHPGQTAGIPGLLPTPGLPIAFAAEAGRPPASCQDSVAIMKAFYDANDASRFDVSLGFFTEDATLSTWAEGVNGYHARARQFTGKKEIRPVLGSPGLRRTSDKPDGPIYHEARAKVSGDRLTFMLEPDRRRPNGKLYNPYRVEVVLVGCKIKALTVIDSVTWL